MNKQETINILENIAEEYKKKYSLNTFIDISSSGEYCYYNCLNNYIVLSLSYVLLRRGGDLTDYIFALLHEIKHAIDYTYNTQEFINETKGVNWVEYNINLEYHDKQPFEIRANEFAKKELERLKINKELLEV
jgi:hypothetical protein